MNNIILGSNHLQQSLICLESSIMRFQQNERTYELAKILHEAFIFVENICMDVSQLIQSSYACPKKCDSKPKPKKAVAKVAKAKLPVMAEKKVVKKVVVKKEAPKPVAKKVVKKPVAVSKAKPVKSAKK